MTVIAESAETKLTLRFFKPGGMRFLDFSLSGMQGVSCTGQRWACLACGLAWASLNPEELRMFIDNHGTDETKLKLSPFRKAPPEQDLV